MMNNQEMVLQFKSEPKMFDCFNQIERYQCESCPGLQTALWVSLRRHIRAGHSDQSPGSEEDGYKCLKCLFVTYSKYLIVRHGFFGTCAAKYIEKIEERFAKFALPTSFHKELKDAQLSKSVHPKVKSNQKSSANSHKSNTWWHCKQCLYKCKSNSILKQHNRYRHMKPEDIPWFECDHCTSKFKTKANLKTHLIFRHFKPEEIQWFQCEQCPLKFKRKGDLRNHVISRHTKPEDISWHECPHCSYKSKTTKTLKQHVNARHTKPEDIRWFKCEQCPGQFNRKRSLQAHVIALHTKPEDVPWRECPHCSFKCKQRGHLKLHINGRHTKPADGKQIFNM